ncbi:unnamed protein product, partial [marine sediment metagenome]
ATMTEKRILRRQIRELIETAIQELKQTTDLTGSYFLDLRTTEHSLTKALANILEAAEHLEALRTKDSS